MILIRAFSVAIVASLLVEAPQTFAQSVGGPVPAYQAPAPAPPPHRTDNITVPPPRDNPFASQEQVGKDFAAAYKQAGRPRLAFFWNRQLADTLNEWYGNSRVVVTNQNSGTLGGNLTSPSLSGELALQGSGSSQTTIEAQRRITGQERRLQPSESWEWQFQEGFLGPFLTLGATVVDRAAIIRLTAAGSKGADPASVETIALQGMADFLVEVLVTPQAQSTVGYELRARVLDVKTGGIVAYVNSRSLKEWNPPKEAIASSRGLELAEDDDDDETFGPQLGDAKYKATREGFVRTRRPPKLSVISQNLAYHVMNGLISHWR